LNAALTEATLMSRPSSPVHACEKTPAGIATLGDIVPADIEAIVRYWHSGGADLRFLGIDPLLLGTPEDTRRRFLRAIRSGEQSQRSVAFGIRVDETLIGYTLLNRYAPEINYSHWHIIVSDLRASGISTALYPHRIAMYFRLTAMKRLTHQTRTRNIGVNRMLDKYVPIAETRYIERPDGVAGPGDFHLRHVSPEDVPALFRKAAALKRSATQT
jgi:hypothetical protein